jgi:hypothetical protein
MGTKFIWSCIYYYCCWKYIIYCICYYWAKLMLFWIRLPSWSTSWISSN